MPLKPDPGVPGLPDKRRHASVEGIFPMSATASVATRHDWSLAEVRALFEQPFNDLLFQAQSASRVLRPEPRTGLDAAVDQDRRLSRGLQVLPAVRPLQHRPGQGEADGGAEGPRGGGRGQGHRFDPLLHGRCLEAPVGQGHALRPGDGQGREEARPGDLHDPRPPDPGADPGAGGRRPRLLQPQPWIPRRSSTATSSPPAPTASACRPWPTCARRG